MIRAKNKDSLDIEATIRQKQREEGITMGFFPESNRYYGAERAA